jgi:hypothetical protein
LVIHSAASKSKYLENTAGNLVKTLAKGSSSGAGKCTRFCSAFQPELRAAFIRDLAGQKRTSGKTFVQ